MRIKKALFICATPFQARICSAIIEKYLDIEYDLIYFTRNDTFADRVSYKILSEKSSRPYYMLLKPKTFVLPSQILTMRSLIHDNYHSVYLSNLQFHAFRYAIKKTKTKNIYTFDDGAANFFRESQMFNEGCIGKLKTKLLLLPSIKEVVGNVKNHFSVNRNIPNVVQRNKLIYLDLNFQNIEIDSYPQEITLFLGQPFTEYLNSQEIDNLKQWLREQNVDYYLKHPREDACVVHNIPVFESNGYLAEDVINSYLNAGSQVTLLSGFTTVLFNISHQNLRKIYLSISMNEQLEARRLEVLTRTDVEIKKV